MADGFDIFVATRFDLASEFANPVLLRGEAGDQLSAKILGDNLTLFYTNLPQIYLATRASTGAPWAAGTPVSELSGMGTRSFMGAVSLDGLEAYFENDETALGGVGDDDVWRATRASTQVPFDAPVKDLSLSTTSDDVPLFLFDNDLTHYFASTRPMGKGNHDIWVATRSAKNQPWSTFTPLTEINTPDDELSFVLTPNGQTAYFSSSFSMPGQHDIWKATRTCLAP